VATKTPAASITDPTFELVCTALPDTGRDLRSQLRLPNASYPGAQPALARIIPDIDLDQTSDLL
jgi:hypothetical protein